MLLYLKFDCTNNVQKHIDTLNNSLLKSNFNIPNFLYDSNINML